MHPRRFIKVSLGTASLLSGCVATPPPAAMVSPAAGPPFDAIAFFTGRTEGTGVLRKLMSGAETTRVEGTGALANGVLRLEQQVREGDNPVRTRVWTIREDAPGHYTGTLSDAEGRVTGESHGNQLHLAFTMKGGLPTEQWLTLSPDGRHAANVMKVRKFGVAVAALSEDIRRLD